MPHSAAKMPATGMEEPANKWNHRRHTGGVGLRLQLCIRKMGNGRAKTHFSCIHPAVLIPPPEWYAVAPMKVARSKKGMVVAAHSLAAHAGKDVLAEGGNAVEAAVTVSLTLAVVEPHASGLGGGGLMMVSPNGSPGKTEVLDGRARLSSLATENYIYPKGVMLPWVPKTGPMSASVPGLAPLLQLALEKYGRKTPLAKLLRKPITLASDGFEVGEVFCYCSALFEGTIRGWPECARIFLSNGARFKPGERLVQKDLARTLARMILSHSARACTIR